MASLPATEDEYDFVEEPSEDFYCPVTLELLREPHQTACCGKHLSQEAVTRLQGQPCPVCKERRLKTTPDKYFKRKVNEFKVRCRNKSLGCEWVGELGVVDRHLSHSSVEGKCQFVTVACPYSCGSSFQRCQLEGHKVNDCPNRPFTCQFCDYEAIYITVTNDHWPICVKYPVYCPNKSVACQWNGEQGDLDQHLNDDSEEGECQFVVVACPHDCGRCFQRRQLQEHKARDCLNRPFTCQYCGHEATYIKVTNEHWPICKQYPSGCPNQCGENVIERQQLPQHLQETCPLQVIKCEFSYAGCEVECQRQYMQTHLHSNVDGDPNVVSHILQCKIEQQQSIIEQQQSINEQQQSIIEQLQSIIEQLQKQIVAALHVNVQKPLAIVPVFVSPSVIVMTDFEKHKKAGDCWYSPPFYSHIGGYKMGLHVYANGDGRGKATHVSVYCHLNRGEYDDQLEWPFRGYITMQLLNQSRDEGHQEMTASYDDTVSDKHAGRVVGKERAKGWGHHKFIAHTKLNTENKDYLKNDCLKFRISVHVNSICET